MIREKKLFAVITFATTEFAMAFEQYCLAHQIPGRPIPVPGEIKAGCGIAWRMLSQDYEKYHQELETSSLVWEQVTELWLY